MARRAWWVLTVLLPVFLCLSPGRQAGAGPITVMTQNLYLGADTNPILTATTQAELQAAVQAAAQSVIDNKFFPNRAAAIASQAKSAGGPLLIGLQEAEIVSGSGGSLNYADALIGALKAQGLNYTYAAVHKGFSLNLPGPGITRSETSPPRRRPLFRWTASPWPIAAGVGRTSP